jgi:hypothetical protein
MKAKEWSKRARDYPTEDCGEIRLLARASRISLISIKKLFAKNFY